MSDKIPVFINDGRFDRIEDVVGQAKLDIKEDPVTVTIETTSEFKKFVEMGSLKALYLGAYSTNVDPDKAAEWREARKKKEEIDD